MHIHRQTLKANALKTIAWAGSESLIDWEAGGRLYSLDGHRTGDDQLQYGFGLPCDSCLTSATGTYAFVYQKRGTKGLLLKNGSLLREINRSYYHADDYEYPAAFATVADATYLIHCPLKYCRLDFEEVETGELVTNVSGRDPSDFFHSRLEVSPGGTFLLSKGWAWHPWDMVQAFDIAACLTNPLLLDNTELRPSVGTEVCTAGFISDELVLLGTSNEEAMDEDLESVLPPESVASWHIHTNELSPPVRVVGEFGNVFPLSKKLAWDLYRHPKLLDLTTGVVLASLPTLNTGLQRSAIIRHDVPTVAFNRATGRVAVKHGSTIEVLSVTS